MIDLTPVTIETRAPVVRAAVWAAFDAPEAITHRHCPRAEIDLRICGRRGARMGSKDGSMGVDDVGTCEKVDAPHDPIPGPACKAVAQADRPSTESLP
ncbi:MAG: hypothetical protein ACK4TG_08775 [Thermaurantiacus sp.]